jgi:hypothetical protein
MGEEFYAAIKLISGEEIFSLISVDENNGDPIIILQNPVIMKVFTNYVGMYVKIKPWMEIPNDDIFFIKFDRIITMTEIKNQSTIDFYLRYLEDDSDIEIESNGKVSISDKMGYLGSVENSRKSLEDIFLKDLKDNKES